MKYAASLIALTLACSIVPSLSRASEKPEQPGSIRVHHHVRRADLPDLARITLTDAARAARTACPGHVIEVELEVDDGFLIYSCDVVGPDKSVTEVEIDAGTGRVLEIERDDD